MRKLLITLLLLLLPLSLHALSLDSSVTLYYGIETQDDKREDGMILRNSIRAEMVSNPFTLVFDNISIGPSLGFEFTYDSEPVSGIRLIGHEGAVFALNFKYSFQDSFSLGLEGGIGVGHYNYMDMSYASLNGYLIGMSIESSCQLRQVFPTEGRLSRESSKSEQDWILAIGGNGHEANEIITGSSHLLASFQLRSLLG